jgi:hypothetical protein
MGSDVAGMADVSAPVWDRFAHWGKLPARLLLLAMALILIASALVPINAGRSTIKTANSFEILAGKKGPARARDDDLRLYDKAIERIRKGENYYDFILAEQRKANYPVRPGFAVRLPTLAYINAWLGTAGQITAAILLMAATLLVWWRRLGEEPGVLPRRTVATALLFLGAIVGGHVTDLLVRTASTGQMAGVAGCRGTGAGDPRVFVAVRAADGGDGLLAR